MLIQAWGAQRRRKEDLNKIKWRDIAPAPVTPQGIHSLILHLLRDTIGERREYPDISPPFYWMRCIDDSAVLQTVDIVREKDQLNVNSVTDLQL